jgi:DNA-binding GntR family transcriptional regulator
MMPALPAWTPAQTAEVAAFLLEGEKPGPGRAAAQAFDEQASALVAALRAGDAVKAQEAMLLTLQAVFGLRADLIPKKEAAPHG